MPKETSNNMSNLVWKVNISKQFKLEDIESILGDSLSNGISQGSAGKLYGFLERVDISDKETTVYITGDEVTIKVFSEKCIKLTPNVKVVSSTISPSDVTKFA